LRDEPAFSDNDIVEVIDVKAMRIQYLPEVTVFMLRHRATGEERVAAFRHSRYLAGESEALQRLFENGTAILSSEAESLQPAVVDIPVSLPRPVARIAQSVIENTAKLTTLETELAAREEDRSTTQDQRERDEVEARIQQLKEEMERYRAELSKNKEELSKSKVEFLKTEQHRALLEQALRDAQEEVIIISPWMNRRTCNDYLCHLFGDAIRRGVRIRIEYGMGRERNQQEAEINRINVREVQAAIKRYIPRSLDHMLDMRQTSGSHQKILICDRTLGITGSFNWLSYTGLQDDYYRSEMSTVFRNPEHVNQLAQIAIETLDGGPQPLHGPPPRDGLRQ
jgi:phosphatidylserine/phosphatidylglycerophosphate/cardiolipin synthase-like enzyme